MSEQQEALAGDYQRLTDYGRRHPATWAGVRFVGARLVASFTDPEPHREALAALLDRPDLLDLRRVPRAAAELAAVRREAERRAVGRMHASSMDEDAVELHLTAGSSDLAQELHEAYGDALRLQVGALRFPFAPAPAPAPRPAPRTTHAVPGLVLLAVPAGGSVVAGDDLTGALRLHNTSEQVVALDTDQPLRGHLLAGGRVVGVGGGGSRGTGLRLRLLPGQEASVRWRAGTGSDDPSVGPVLPAGAYDVVVVVPVHSPTGARQQLVSPPVQVRVTGPVEGG